jgi:opacity protein-like surface antigen
MEISHVKYFALALCLGLTQLSLVNGQEMHRFSFDVDGGFTQPVGNTGRHLNEGWNIGGGVGYNFNSYLGAMVQLDYNSFGINGTTLTNIGVPGGDVHIFSATLDPIVHLNPQGHLDVYLIGGGGLYHRTQEFTQPSVATVTGFDPFFGFFQAAVPATSILASYSVNKPGANIGAGVALGTKWHGKFFAEARYHHIFLGNGHTDYIPVSLGFRW